jgi:hypothetical protein
VYFLENIIEKNLGEEEKILLNKDCLIGFTSGISFS